MDPRSRIATGLLNYARKMGQSLGCELVIEVSDHSIETSMEVPNKHRWGWDSNLFKRGQLFIKGYANPIKPIARKTRHPKKPDRLALEEGESDPEPLADGGENPQAEDPGAEFELIPSYRYREHQDQHLISQLVNPSEQWRMLVYGIIGLGALIFFNIIIVLYATGSFG